MTKISRRKASFARGSMKQGDYVFFSLDLTDKYKLIQIIFFVDKMRQIINVDAVIIGIPKPMRAFDYDRTIN